MGDSEDRENAARPNKMEDSGQSGSEASRDVGQESGQSQAKSDGPQPAGDAMAALEARVKELEAQQEDLTDRLLRAHAEMENIRKRSEREKADTAKYAISKFANDIVGVGDNFQRAMTAVPPGAAESDGTLKSLLEGVQMTERELLHVLERHGVKRIEADGVPFNPNVHQAVMEQDRPDVPAGTIVQVFQGGYMIDDRVLRPAMVVVARGGSKPSREASASTTGASSQVTPANDDTPDAAGGSSAS
jgi:molecular chaperone GrpE